MLDVEKINHNTHWKIEKYENDRAFKLCQPYEVSEFDENCLLNAGITNANLLIIGSAGTAYNHDNAKLGVGSVTTAENASQTGLQDASPTFIAMESGYPSNSAQTISWKSSFGAGDANVKWQEFAVDCGTGDAAVFNRKVSDQGSKTSGQTWVLTLEITLS